MRKGGNKNARRESAARIREIRRNSGFTQEEFAELIDFSLSAYKKIESGENGASVNFLEKVEQKLHVSADYILFGKQEELDEVWKLVLNSSEQNKAMLLMRLMHYFVRVKPGMYVTEEAQSVYDERLEEVLKEIGK